MSKSVMIGVGANLGDAKSTVIDAIEKLAQLPQTSLKAQSSLFLTAPIDSSGDNYINAVVELDTALSAEELLGKLQQLELDCGRERPYRNAPRTLDLDILLYDNQTIHTERLTIPHPRMTERAFVLIPLLQINPFITIPGKRLAHEYVLSVADQRISKIL